MLQSKENNLLQLIIGKIFTDALRSEPETTAICGNAVPVVRKLDVGQYVVVCLLTTKCFRKYFVAQVKRVILKELEVKFLKRHRNYFVFPEIDDVSLVDGNSIVEILPDPDVTRRNQLIFTI